MQEKFKVLIVDDVPESIQILLNGLKDDFITVVASNGQDALEAAIKDPQPDVIILDIIMPDMSGYDVCKHLKSSNATKDIPVIFISVLDDVSAILEGFKVGGVDYVTKPFNIREVKTRLAAHLELASQRKILEENLHREHTQRIKQEKKMIQQEKMAAMGEMLALITHQWRQPLHTIGTIVSNVKIKNSLGDDDFLHNKLEGSMDSVEDNVKHLSQTINDFSNFFKTDKLTKNIYLHEVVEKAIDLMGDTLKAGNISVDYSSCHFESRVSLFVNELLQVLLNIIKNSVDAFSENSTEDSMITISSEENENEKVLHIHDNGGGISEDHIKHIFDSDFTTKAEDQGTGLGLYMCKIIIEEHFNGKLTVENSDKGLLFSIYIPA